MTEYKASHLLLDTGSEGWVLVGEKTLQVYLRKLIKMGINIPEKQLPTSSTEYVFGVGSQKVLRTSAIPILHPVTKEFISLEVDVLPGALPFVAK